MDNMTFGKYIPGNSIIHRLDPRLKICAVFIFLISVFFDAGFIGYGILAIYVLLCSLVSKIKLSHLLKAISYSKIESDASYYALSDLYVLKGQIEKSRDLLKNI